MATVEGQSGTNGTNGHHAEGFGHRVEQIGSSAQQLWTEARSAVQDLNHTLDLKGRVDRHPYGMVLAAVGVGYILGGGLLTPLTARLIRLGIRLAAFPLIREELVGIAESTLDALQQKAAPSGGESPTSVP